VAWSQGWGEPLEAAQSNWFLEYSQYDLWLLATILSDSRFPSYLSEANRQIRVNYVYLRGELAAPLAVAAMDAGCFCLVDAGGLGLDDVSYAEVLRDRYQALVVPVSWFPARMPAPETRVRISLARSGEEIARLTAALNDSAAACARRMPGVRASNPLPPLAV
jgi:aspartate/methionine/tyrosine aminotransferase